MRVSWRRTLYYIFCVRQFVNDTAVIKNIKLYCKVWHSLLLIFKYKFTSIAYYSVGTLESCIMSLINKLNSRGPNTDLCGTLKGIDRYVITIFDQLVKSGKVHLPKSIKNNIFMILWLKFLVFFLIYFLY